jgi:hypothetical protein
LFKKITHPVILLKIIQPVNTAFFISNKTSGLMARLRMIFPMSKIKVIQIAECRRVRRLPAGRHARKA